MKAGCVATGAGPTSSRPFVHVPKHTGDRGPERLARPPAPAGPNATGCRLSWRWTAALAVVAGATEIAIDAANPSVLAECGCEAVGDEITATEDCDISIGVGRRRVSRRPVGDGGQRAREPRAPPRALRSHVQGMPATAKTLSPTRSYSPTSSRWASWRRLSPASSAIFPVNSPRRLAAVAASLCSGLPMAPGSAGTPAGGNPR